MNLTPPDPCPEGVILEESEVPCAKCRYPFTSRTMEFRAADIKMTIKSSICPDCVEVEDLRRAESEAKMREDLIQQRNKAKESLWEQICPVEFRTTTEGGKTEIARLELSCKQLPDILAWQYGSTGLIVRGENRTGKTRAVWRLMRKLFNDNKSIVFITNGEFERQCRDAGGGFTLTKWFNKLATVDVLFFDDLGKTPWSDATEGMWFDLVDTRTRDNRPFIITTNFTGAALSQKMDVNRAAAVIGRLRDFCSTIVVNKS